MSVSDSLERALSPGFGGDLRFDRLSRALYSTDASVYQIEPLAVAIPRSRADVQLCVEVCRALKIPLTMRGGGTSQAGQAIGAGLIVDTSRYFNRILEVNPEQRWARVEPGVVLDDLNAALKPHGLRFAPDITTANRATIGGMIANNASGARSVIYGKTIDHVLEQQVVLSDGSLSHFRPLTTQEIRAAYTGSSLEAEIIRSVHRLAREHAADIARRFPKVLRRVGGYNLDAFVEGAGPFNLARMIVGSEGTLGVVVEAKLNLVPLPRFKALVTVEFETLSDALGATPAILKFDPSAVEVMDRFILSHAQQNAALDRLRQRIMAGDPGALLCIEFYADQKADLPQRLNAFQSAVESMPGVQHQRRWEDNEQQAMVWKLREAALGLSMAMKDDAKCVSFVEDTAVAPARLRDYMERFMQIVHRHGTVAGVYAHASVGCLHVRPVVNLKTGDGVRMFESIANAVSDLVLEFGGALSGEHGDGLVRSPFARKMFGPELYEAFRAIKRTFDPAGILNPGKIVDAPPMTYNLRQGPGYISPAPETFFDYSEYGGMGGAVEMCSGVGACRKRQEGTMCPSYMVTLDEKDSTRGRANALRMAMLGKLGESGLGERHVYDALDLCLECRACKSECPVGVDMARFKSEFLADYQRRFGVTLRARLLGRINELSHWGSRCAPLSNWLVRGYAGRWLGQRWLGLDKRRKLPAWRFRTFENWLGRHRRQQPKSGPLIFIDTFTNYYHPAIGIAAAELMDACGQPVRWMENFCCGRPLISQGLLAEARIKAEGNAEIFFETALRGDKILFLEPSCLSAVKEDAPALLRGRLQQRARTVAEACMLFEDYLERELQAERAWMVLRRGPPKILLHAHCHQRSMGLLEPARALLSRIPQSTVQALDSGCCGMAGSFGYLSEHYELSRQIGELRLLPAVRARDPETVVVASGMSCRTQLEDFAGCQALHPAQLLRSLLPSKE